MARGIQTMVVVWCDKGLTKDFVYIHYSIEPFRAQVMSVVFCVPTLAFRNIIRDLSICVSVFYGILLLRLQAPMNGKHSGFKILVQG